MKTVKDQVSGAVAWFDLARPAKRNALIVRELLTGSKRTARLADLIEGVAGEFSSFSSSDQLA